MFATKAEAREAVWSALEESRNARFPFPPRGRIPNFAGARQAAERLMALPEMQRARRIKVNPDAPQRPVREAALRAGKTVFMPTPRLRAGFLELRDAKNGPEVPLAKLPDLDLIVVGSVAVTRAGRRCGKGAGYADLEYAILRELGHPPVPVVTTVHSLQLCDGFPTDEHDLPVSIIVTPDEVIRVKRPPRPPRGIDWDRLPDGALDDMPVLAELAALKKRRR